MLNTRTVKGSENHARWHGSLEGARGLKTTEAYNSIADTLSDFRKLFFDNFTGAFFGFFYKIRHLFLFACTTGYDAGGTQKNRISSGSEHPA